jgi:hypothetical protein
MNIHKLIIVCWIFIGCKSIQSQTKTDETGHYQPKEIKGYMDLGDFSGDTTQYLYRNFVKPKSAYVGQPLQKLLQQLEIPLWGYSISPNGADMSTTQSIVLHIYDDRRRFQIEKEKGNPNALVIIWSKPLSIEEVRSILAKSSTLWDKSARDYFSSKTVGDIVLTGFLK